MGRLRACWEKLIQLWYVGSGDRWQYKLLQPCQLPASQESKEFRLPGGHPTWAEGTGAKEEKVSDGWGQKAGHGSYWNGMEKQNSTLLEPGSPGQRGDIMGKDRLCWAGCSDRPVSPA